MKSKAKIIGGISLIIALIAIPIGIFTPEIRVFLELDKIYVIDDKFNDDFSNETIQYGEFVDERDNKLYKWTKIGNQIWMAENLAFIPSGNCDFELWIEGFNDSFEDKWYCIYNNEDKYLEKYGILYTWKAIEANEDCDICPNGWHVATDEDWKELEMFIGMNQSLIDEIKYRGNNEAFGLKSNMDWSRNGNGNNEYGFNSLPGGYRHYGDGKFYNIGNYSLYWTATELSEKTAFFRSFRYEDNKINRYYDDKRSAFYIRCIKNLK
ncbi:MAG: hypothetical protein KAS71_06130 [Bacteroidales bacterium]|nr:hypothetical protein [Bacteroidales bacterium]